MSQIALPWRRLLNTETSIEHLLRPNDLDRGSAIDLDELDRDLFIASEANLWQPAGGIGVFGGQVLGQALHAATLTANDVLAVAAPSRGRDIQGQKVQTTPPTSDADATELLPFECHSMHAYFLRAGDASRPIVHRVKRTRDGRSFLARSVESRQRGRVIFKLSASFHRPEPDKGIDHQPIMPDVPPPEVCERFDYDALVRRIISRHGKEDGEGAGGQDGGGGGGDGRGDGGGGDQEELETSLSRAKNQVLRSVSRAIPMDIRWVGPEPSDRTPRPARQLAWMKVSRSIGDGVPDNVHRCVGAFFSDYFLLAPSL